MKKIGLRIKQEKSEKLLQKEKNGVSYLQFPNLEAFPCIRHAVFTRKGGVSAPPHDSLNVSYAAGDRDDAVTQNRQKILTVMDTDELVFARQVHGAEVLSFTENDFIEPRSAGAAPRTGDAMISSARGKTLVLKVADCQPVLMVDPVSRVIAAVHSGWRGSLQNIVGRTVDAMKDRFGSDPRDIVAGLGPSLGPCCAEFVNYQTEIPKPLWIYKQRRVFFDFWSMTRDQLIDAGVLNENIHVSGICTRCRADMFFSYRKQNHTGRFAAAIGLV
jgi:polyphenol oxidase